MGPARDAAREKLRAAALEAGLGDDEVEKTLRSADEGASRVGPWRDETDAGNAELLIDTHGADLLHVTGLGWHAWDGARFAPDETGEITRRVIDVANTLKEKAAAIDDDDLSKKKFLHAFELREAKQIRNAVSLACSDARVAFKVDALDVGRMLLNVKNGTIDLRTGELLPHHREDRITKLAPIAHDVAATCPTWLAFLGRIFAGDEALVAYVQRAIGYSLTGDVSEHALFLCYGDGANGKSTFLNLLLAMLGDYAGPTPPGMLLVRVQSEHQTEIVDLRGRRVTTASEIKEGKSFDKERVKWLTGGDTLKGRKMHRDHVSFDPTHKFWIATNHKPEIQGVDAGIWRRMKLIPFTVTIPEAEQDKHLDAKLCAEISGILNWAITGCLAWKREGLRDPPAVKQATVEYRAEQDVVGRFVSEKCESDSEAITSGADLYQAFKWWASANGEREISQAAFSPRLAKLGFEKTKQGVMKWSGLRLRIDTSTGGAPVWHSMVGRPN